MKAIYTSPHLETVSFESEKGFATSGEFDSNNRTEIFVDDEDYKL